MHNLTQKELAKILMVSERQLQNIEAGTSKGSMSFWKRASEFFNTPIDELI